MTDQFEMFDCVARSLRLTKKGCAKLWESARDDPPQPHEGRFSCRSCAVGAANAGKPHDQFAAIRDELRPFCVRCQKVSDRIIGGRFCPSCYNRDREVRIGKNAKGGFPNRVASTLAPVRILVTRDGASKVEEQLAAGAEEVIIATAKTARGPMSWSLSSVALMFNGEQIDPLAQADDEEDLPRRRRPLLPAWPWGSCLTPLPRHLFTRPVKGVGLGLDTRNGERPDAGFFRASPVMFL